MVLAALLMCALPACSQSVPGNPTAGPDVAVTPARVIPAGYGVPLTAEQTALLDSEKAWRTWDPCALFDPGVLGALGPVETIAMGEWINVCDVDYVYDRSNHWNISLKLGDSFGYIDGGPRIPDKVDGREVLRQSKDGRGLGQNFCDYGVPLGYGGYAEMRVSWNDPSTAPTPACAVAQRLTIAMMQRLVTPALRSQTRAEPYTPLLTADPCSGVAALTLDHRVNLSLETASLHNCYFYFDGNYSGASLQVSMHDPYELAAKNGRSTARIGNYEVDTSESGNSCDVEGKLTGPLATHPWMGMPGLPGWLVLKANGRTCVAAQAIYVATADAILG